MRSLAFTAAALALAVQGNATLANDGKRMDFTITIGTQELNGTCYVTFPRTSDGMELEISSRADDGNTVISVHNIPAEWVVDEEKDVIIQLVTDDGTAFDTDLGVYRAGFTYRTMGLFNDPAEGLQLLSTLKGGQTYAVNFDGHDVGTFDIQQGGETFADYAYDYMKSCLANNGGDTGF